MLEKLGQIIKKATDKIANAIFLDKNLVDSIIRDLQRVLIEADINISLVKQLTDKIKKTAFDTRIKEIEKKEHIIKLLHDELLAILGEYKPLRLDDKKQNRIMLIGLYGCGKTSTIAKIGNYYAKRGNKVALIGLDTHRPAAPEQLKQLAEKNKLNYFIDTQEKNPVKIWDSLEKKGTLKDYNLILIDTAGRHNLDKTLLEEIKALEKHIKPTDAILVIPADIGKAAKSQAQQFKEAVNISGVIITRMDSTAKGGGALTACAETKAPVFYITTGEKINDLEEFNPSTFLSRILGMGDLEALIEKIKSVTGEKEQEKLQKKLQEGKLTLNDVIEQIKSMGSLGGFQKIKSMIPGFSNIEDKIPENLIETQEAKISKWEHILKSMTPEERENPELLKKEHSRINRVAKGSGVNNSDIRALLKQYDMLNSFIKDIPGAEMDMQGFDQKKLMKLAKKFGKKKMMRF